MASVALPQLPYALLPHSPLNLIAFALDKKKSHVSPSLLATPIDKIVFQSLFGSFSP